MGPIKVYFFLDSYNISISAWQQFVFSFEILPFRSHLTFHVRFCQATFATFSCFSYIWSAILLTYVAIGVVCCQNQNLLYLCSCSSKDIFLHFTPAAGKPSFPTFHRPRTFQTFADNMPHAKNVWIRGQIVCTGDAPRPVPRFVQRRQEKRRQNRNDRNNNQKFNQGKSFSPHDFPPFSS